MQPLRALAFMAAAAALAGCGDSTGTGPGRANAFVTDDPSTTSASRTGAVFQLSGANQAAAFSGSVAGNTQVSISADGETWVDLGSLNGITILLQSSSDSTTVHGEVDVPAGTYSRVRLTFSGVEARLDAGSTFGGLTLTTQVNVSLGGSDAQVMIEKSVPSFEVRAEAGAVTIVRFELNAEAWLTEQTVGAEVVEDAEIQAAVTARVTAG